LAQCDVSERTDIDALVKAAGESTPPLSRLFTLGRIANVELKNRIVMPSMTTRNADREGNVTENTIAYFCARADGGVGLITVEMASPEKAGRHRNFELGIYGEWNREHNDFRGGDAGTVSGRL
jgi:2,4-dienoyl-CoA reductase-like NADH-dependent reductase (Old Yellow Enzyme family)